MNFNELLKILDDSRFYSDDSRYYSTVHTTKENCFSSPRYYKNKSLYQLQTLYSRSNYLECKVLTIEVVSGIFIIYLEDKSCVS